MIYDTIEYCELHQQLGLLIILDFRKAFTTIKWSFRNNTLSLFNFGEKFMEMIDLCQKNSSSMVEQTGLLSEKLLFLGAAHKVFVERLGGWLYIIQSLKCPNMLMT